MKSIHCLWPLVLIPCAHAQTTWHVDAHGSAPGSGTASDPYTSINYAIHAPATADNDTILVRPGVYSGLVKLDRAIVVRSTDGPLATQIRGGGTLAELGFAVTTWNVRLEGFSFVRTGTNAGSIVRIFMGELARCIVIGNGVADGVRNEDAARVDHCVVTGCHYGITEQPLYAYGCDLSNSVVWGNGYDAHFGLGFITYSVVDDVLDEEALVGPGVLRVAPGLFDLSGHDFHPLASSVCINAGNPAAPQDPDGSVSDIGAIVFDATYAPFESYCTAKTNSLGCVPAIGASGTPSYSSTAPFPITCTNELNQKLGLLFYGYAPKNAQYQGGYLCVQSPVHRTALSSSGGSAVGEDCSGVFSYDFNALIASHADPALEPAAEVFAQFWSRDPNASFTTNRSDAIRFVVQP